MKDLRDRQSGIALIIVLLLMLIFTIIMLGFYFQTTGEQKVASSDRDSTVAFYAAQGAIENMSSDLAALFASIPSPTPTQVTNLTGSTYQQAIPIYNSAGTSISQGVTFSVYTITNLPTPATTNPTTAACTPSTAALCSTPGIIPGNGPLAGLEGLITPFLLTVVADGANNTEVKMTRQVQEVAVPVFQYGIFSQTDLSYFAGPDFGFGGRTATNGNLFLAENGGTLTLNDKVTAYLSIIRSQLSNGLATTTSYNTSVNVTAGGTGGCPTPTCPACTPSNGPPVTCRTLATTEGSVTGGPGSAANPNWQSLSMNTYGGYIRSGSTGVKQLNLALALAGASPIAMIQRPLAGENPASEIGGDRLFNQASVRILLSDSATQITNLPGVTATAPLQLTSALNTVAPIALPVDNCHPPIALSPGYAVDNDYMSPAGTTLLGGYIKIEIQLNATPGTWQDVTKEVLSTGISSSTVATPTMSAPNTPTQVNGGSLAASTTYYYFITALGPWGESVQSSPVSKATTSTKKTLNLTWTAMSGATGYRVYAGTSSGGETGYFSAAGTSYSHTTMTGITSASPPTPCTNISILHLEEAIPGIAAASTAATNFVPINIYDPREGEVRDSNSNNTSVSLNGVMNLLEVDVGNLQKWLSNTLCSGSTVPTSCSSGALALNNSGYILYVSDRRGNCNQAGSGPCSGTVGTDTGEYGNEDLINPASGVGTPNNTLDTGEDVDGDGVFRKYGATPRYIAIDGSTGSPWPAFMLTMPTTNPAFVRINSSSTCTPSAGCVAQKNSVVLFRHAVRLVDGTLGNLPPLAAATMATCPNALTPAQFPSQGGFSVASENPVYVQGDYNASASVGAFNPDPSGNCHVPAAVMADAVTLLSNTWDDSQTFTNPTNVGNRPNTTTTWYRLAIIAGKNPSFPLPTFTAPAAPPNDFGTDGGTHNFLRYIEDWQSTVNYLGSMCSFYYARQATGVYKCCNTVYNAPPTRAYAFDTDFSNITSLPPGTPRFTDVNALSYQQATQATQ